MGIVYKFGREKNVYISSDLHLNHDKVFIYEKRGFASIEEHRVAVIKSINDTVAADDILILLGDTFLNTKEDQFNQTIGEINCQHIYMLPGNHPNPGNKIYKREVELQYGRSDIEVYPIKYKNVRFLPPHVDMVIYGKYVVLNHFPIEVWDHMKDGSYMLCGHSHGSLPSTQLNSTNGLTLDCGWDVHGKVLHFNDIIDIMSRKSIRRADHHVTL